MRSFRLSTGAFGPSTRRVLESVRQFISQSHTRKLTMYFEFFSGRNHSSKCLPSDARNGNPFLVVMRSLAVKIDGGARATSATNDGLDFGGLSEESPTHKKGEALMKII